MTTPDRIIHFIATEVETSKGKTQSGLVLETLHDSKLTSHPKQFDQKNQISLSINFSCNRNLQLCVKSLNSTQNYGSISFISDTFTNLPNGSYKQRYLITAMKLY